MYRIRLHGRGGQGTKTAGRILGSAFFAEGYEVQDAPRYGAERRGAPISATVRAARRRIDERGVIARPDLVVVADASLVALAEAGVLVGVEPRATLLVAGSVPPLDIDAHVVALPIDERDAGTPFVATRCAGAAARLCGVIRRASLEDAVRRELSGMRPAVVERDVAAALDGYDAIDERAGSVTEGAEHAGDRSARPAWIELPLDDPHFAAPSIHGGATSLAARTGLWRTLRPEIDPELCRHCAWVCSTLCPDGAITANGGVPVIDLEHCKGCLVCVEQCPWHAISVLPGRTGAEP